MRGINKVIILGTLGNDPEVKQFPNGGSITTISVATSEQWNDKQTGEKREATEWHRIQFSNKLAEIAAQYLRKGSKVYTEGKLKTRKYQDNTGQDRYVTEIQALELQMLGDNPNNGQQAQQGNYSAQQNTGYQKTPQYPQGAREMQGNFQTPQGQAYANQMVANAPQPNYGNQGYTNMNSGGFANGQPPLNTPRPSDVNIDDVPF